MARGLTGQLSKQNSARVLALALLFFLVAQASASKLTGRRCDLKIFHQLTDLGQRLATRSTPVPNADRPYPVEELTRDREYGEKVYGPGGTPADYVPPQLGYAALPVFDRIDAANAVEALGGESRFTPPQLSLLKSLLRARAHGELGANDWNDEASSVTRALEAAGLKGVTRSDIDRAIVKATSIDVRPGLRVLPARERNEKGVIATEHVPSGLTLVRGSPRGEKLSDEAQRVLETLRHHVGNVWDALKTADAGRLDRPPPTETEASRQLRSNLLAGETDLRSAASSDAAHVDLALDGLTMRNLVALAVKEDEAARGWFREAAHRAGFPEDALRRLLMFPLGENAGRTVRDVRAAAEKAGLTLHLPGHDTRQKFNVAYETSQTASDNEKFLKAVKAMQSLAQKPEGFNLHLENVIMKVLNEEVFQMDPLLSGRFTNLAKLAVEKAILNETFIDENGASRPLSSVLEAVYDDYNSLRVRFRKDTPEVRKAAGRAYESAVLLFEATVKSNRELWDIVNGFGKKNVHSLGSWLAAGTGLTDGEAATAARIAKEGRDKPGPRVRPIIDFSDPSVAPKLAAALDSFERKSEKLKVIFKGRTDVLAQGEHGLPTLTPAAAALLRLDTRELRAAFQRRFGFEITGGTATLMKDVSQSVQPFSQPIYDPGNAAPTLAANSGKGSLFFIDVSGAGAENNAGLFRALSRAAEGEPPPGMSRTTWALKLAREEQDRRSQDFEQNIFNVDSTVRARGLTGDPKFSSGVTIWGRPLAMGLARSGDDVYFRTVEPTTVAEQQRVMQDLANRSFGGRYRFVSVKGQYPDGRAVTAEELAQLAKLGAAAEKKLRSSLEGPEADGRVPFEKLRHVMIGFYLEPDGKGGARLTPVIAGKIGPAVEAAVREAIPGLMESLSQEKDFSKIPLAPQPIQGAGSKPTGFWRPRWRPEYRMQQGGVAA